MSHFEGRQIGEIGAAASQAQLVDSFLRQYLHHQKQIYLYIAAFLRSGSDIDDVLQETSLVLWSKYHEFRPDGDFLRWACGIAKLEVYRFCRNRKGVTMPFDDELFEQLAAERESLNDHLERRRGALSNCIQKLNHRDRELIESCYLAGATTKLVAEQISRPVNAVYQSLGRIRRVLHECVTRALAAQEG
ncbi:MAG: sigma-70 family RNA polymerase sigma factor [Pirellulales bacterium]|nr:sigma-70 family RNA polymerase sigma factor [Pirellulales bacterium]